MVRDKPVCLRTDRGHMQLNDMRTTALVIHPPVLNHRSRKAVQSRNHPSEHHECTIKNRFAQITNLAHPTHRSKTPKLTFKPGLRSSVIFCIIRSWNSGWNLYKLPSTATVTEFLLIRFNNVAIPETMDVVLSVPS